MQYQGWSRKSGFNNDRKNLMIGEMSTWQVKPAFSIVMVVAVDEVVLLRDAINAVRSQLYSNWELLIVNNFSSNAAVVDLIDEYLQKDERIKNIFDAESKDLIFTLNTACARSSGEFIVFMDGCKLLAEHALLEFAFYVIKCPEVDLIYSDHDRIDSSGEFIDPCFKPDWSPELLLSYCYIGEVFVVSREVLFKGGFFREGFVNGREYDLLLRIKDIVRGVCHVADVLYHSRVLSDGIDYNLSLLKKQSVSRNALKYYLEANAIDAEVDFPDFAKKDNLAVCNIKFVKDYEEKISIIMPTKGHYELISSCLKSLVEKTNYKNYEIIIAEAGYRTKKLLLYLKRFGDRVRVYDYRRDRFNFSYVNNELAKFAKGDYLLFLNDDIEVIDGDWLKQMRGTFDLSSQIAAVGAKLLYENDTIQHAGVVLGLYGICSHAFRGAPKDDPGYMYFPHVIRNYSGCTAACLLVKKACFEEIGGYDETLALAYNDVDLCLRFLQKGYRIVYNPNAVLYHMEMASRLLHEYVGESFYFCKKWGVLLDNDPYYNVNLTKRESGFAIKNPDDLNAYIAL